jgi:hypothetical protein
LTVTRHTSGDGNRSRFLFLHESDRP